MKKETIEDRKHVIDEALKLIGTDYMSDLNPSIIDNKCIEDYIEGLITFEEMTEILIQTNNR